MATQKDFQYDSLIGSAVMSPGTLVKDTNAPGYPSGPTPQALTTVEPIQRKMGVLDSSVAEGYMADLAQRKQDSDGRMAMYDLLGNKNVDQGFVQGQLNRTMSDADSYLAGRDPQSADFSTRVNRAFDPRKQKIQEEAALEKQKLSERQQEQSATQRVANYRMGTTGTPYGADVMADLQRDQQRETDALNKAENEAINAAWDASLRGEIGIAKQFSDEAESIKKKIELQKTKQADDQLKTLQAQKLAFDLGEKWAEGMAAKAIETGEEPTDVEFAAMDKTIGLTPGASKNIYGLQRRKVETESIKDSRERQKAELDNANSLLNILDKVPQGQPVTIGGVTYQGQKRGEYASGTEQDKNGNVTYWQIDKQTGKVTTTPLGNIGKSEDGWKTVQLKDGSYWRVNENTGASMPYYASEAQATWNEYFPEGSQSPFRDANDPNQGECAAFCNDLYGQKMLGDTFQEKKDALSQYEVSAGDVQVGDTFLMASGTTGHVGIINSVEEGPNGTVLRFTESNMVPPGGGVISNSRTMDVNDPKLKMFARVPTPNLPLAGTDRKPPSRQVLGAPQETNLAVPSEEQFLREAEQAAFKRGDTSFNPQEAQKVYQATYGAVPVYQDAARNVSLGLTDKKQVTFLKDVDDALSKGDFIKAQDKLKKAALDTAESVTTQQVRGRDQSVKALGTIRNELNAYKQKGGNTNIFSGTIEDVKKKAGLVNDPELRKIATKISAAMADYRRAISGAAFTESERKQYEDMFPAITNMQALNFANIDALTELMNEANETFYRQQLGNENYDAIFNP